MARITTCLAYVCIWAYTAQAYAVEVPFSDGVSRIPLKALGYVALLSMLGGLASTLQKISNPKSKFKNLLLEVVKDLVVSLVAGVVAFALAEQAGMSAMLEAAIITLSGWAGSNYLDKAYRKYLGE
jgi:hypothetical protein